MVKRTVEGNHNKPMRQRIPRTILCQPDPLSRIPPSHLPLPLPLHSAMTHPLTPHPTSPLDRARSRGQTKNTTNITLAHTPPRVPLRDGDHSPGQTRDATNTTMAYAPQLALPRNDDLPLGQSYPLPLRFYLLEVPTPRPGQTYATVIAKNIPLSPPHLPHVPRLGPSYRTTSTQLRKTAETPNGESGLSPGVSRMKFPFDFIYSLTTTHNNTDICSLPYLIISPYLSPLPFYLSSVSDPVVCGHTQKRT
jgi:hypothetical protein